MALIVDLQAVVAEAFGLSREEILSPSRRQKFVLPRQVAMHFSVTMLEKGYSETARAFARDHSTVMHACHKIGEMLQDEDFRKEFDALEGLVRLALHHFPQPKESADEQHPLHLSR